MIIKVFPSLNNSMILSPEKILDHGRNHLRFEPHCLKSITQKEWSGIKGRRWRDKNRSHYFHSIMGIQTTCQSELPLAGQIVVFRNKGVEKGTGKGPAIISTLGFSLLSVQLWQGTSILCCIEHYPSPQQEIFSLNEFACEGFGKKLYLCRGNPWEWCHPSFWQDVFHSASDGVWRWALRIASTCCDFTREVAVCICPQSSQSNWVHLEFSCQNLWVSDCERTA